MDHFSEDTLTALFARIDRLLAQKGTVLLAIDGPCTAGKTTLANILHSKYGCSVFHMDDFFLRPAQRTQSRLSEPGGNVDYERFYEEVIQPLQTGNAFSYRPFSCASQSLSAPVTVSPTGSARSHRCKICSPRSRTSRTVAVPSVPKSQACPPPSG